MKLLCRYSTLLISNLNAIAKNSNVAFISECSQCLPNHNKEVTICFLTSSFFFWFVVTELYSYTCTVYTVPSTTCVPLMSFTRTVISSPTPALSPGSVYLTIDLT